MTHFGRLRGLIGELPKRTAVVHTAPSLEEIGTAAALACLYQGHEHHAAAALGISRRTLNRWKQRAEYEAAATAAHIVAQAEFCYWQDVAEEQIEQRTDWLQRRHERELLALGFRPRQR